MNSKTLQSQRDGVYHFVIPPDAKVHQLLSCMGNEVEFHIFIQRDIGNLDRMFEEEIRGYPLTALFSREQNRS